MIIFTIIKNEYKYIKSYNYNYGFYNYYSRELYL